MGKRLFVGSLPFDITESQLRELFAPCGKVVSAKLIMDRDTGQSKGFGFVDMSSDEEAQAAVSKMHGSAVGSRNLVVNEARPMEKRVPGAPRPGGGFSGRGGNSGGRPSGGFGGRGGSSDGFGGRGDSSRGFDGGRSEEGGGFGKGSGKRRKKGQGKRRGGGKKNPW